MQFPHPERKAVAAPRRSSPRWLSASAPSAARPSHQPLAMSAAEKRVHILARHRAPAVHHKVQSADFPPRPGPIRSATSPAPVGTATDESASAAAASVAAPGARAPATGPASSADIRFSNSATSSLHRSSPQRPQPVHLLPQDRRQPLPAGIVEQLPDRASGAFTSAP